MEYGVDLLSFKYVPKVLLMKKFCSYIIDDCLLHCEKCFSPAWKD